MRTSSLTQSEQKKTGHHKQFNELLSLEDWKYLLKHGEVYEATNGAVLCQQDQISDNLFFVLHGEVKVTGKVNEKSKLLGKLGAGELFGEISALLSVPRIATVAANKPSMILEVNINDFAKLLEKTPSLKDLVLKRLGERSIHTSLQTQQKDELKN